MNKKYFIIIIIAFLILAVAFFYPKTNYIWDDTFTAHTAGQYKNMFCNCVGFTMMKPGLSMSATQVQLCLGIPVNCRYECKKIIDEKWQDISCDQLDHTVP